MEAPENTGSWKSFWKRKFSTFDILTIFRQIWEALAHLHKNNIVHRDVHPTRIHFLNGWAKFNHIGMPYNYKKLLKKENFSGHINYSAPELIKEDSGFDGKVDVWSLGWWLYYLYTKNDPFEGKTPALIKKNILTESIMRDKSSIDPIIQELLNACLIIDPEERPSASQLLTHQNALEWKFYGEVVSKAAPKKNKIEGGKSEILGSPQSSYKSYNNNFLPPASIKNKRWGDLTSNNEDSQVLSKDDSDYLIKEDLNLKSNILDLNSSNKALSEKQNAKTTNNSFNLGELATSLNSQGSYNKNLNTEPGPILANLQDIKLNHDFNVFNEENSGDYSWLNEECFAEKEKRVLSDSARRSSTQPSEEDAEIMTKLISQFNAKTSSNQIEEKKMNNLITTKDTKILQKSSDSSLDQELNMLDQINQYHYVEPNGTMFMGEAIKHGFGILFGKDPDTQQTLTYKGDFKYDLRDGLGQQIYSDGITYNGSWLK